MTENQKKFFEILDDNSYGIIPAPTDPSLGFEILVDYLLPEGWYSCTIGAWQVNTEIVFHILRKYSRRFRKDLKAWRKNKEAER